MTTDSRSLTVAVLLTITLLVTACVRNREDGSNPNVPGATGRTIVPGSNSTMAGDAEATSQQQKWPVGRDR